MTIDITWRVWDMLTLEQRDRLNAAARNNQRLDIKAYRPSKADNGEIVVRVHNPRTGRFSMLHPRGVLMHETLTWKGIDA